jgi:hypothetical protein
MYVCVCVCIKIIVVRRNCDADQHEPQGSDVSARRIPPAARGIYECVTCDHNLAAIKKEIGWKESPAARTTHHARGIHARSMHGAGGAAVIDYGLHTHTHTHTYTVID